jgi:glycosyltransferase involved in cell wall biosynthesis
MRISLMTNLAKLPISVIVPVKNEALNLPDCLASVTWADEVWVVDSHSADETVAIAETHHAKVVQFEFQPGGMKKKNWALENLDLANEWVFFLDADERVTTGLESEIRLLWDRKHNVDGYYVNRRLIFLGRWIKHCGWYPSWNLRLFKRQMGRYELLKTEDVQHTGDVEVHEHVVLTGCIEYLKNDLIHEDFKSIYHFIERHNRYSTWEARVYLNVINREAGDRSIESSFWGGPIERKRFIKHWWARLPGRPLLRFIWMYIVKRGFLDGRPGLLFCALMMMHEAAISAKLFEQQLQRSKPTDLL